MRIAGSVKSRNGMVRMIGALPSMMTTASGNLHGTPLAYATGQDGFPGFQPVKAPISEKLMPLEAWMWCSALDLQG